MLFGHWVFDFVLQPHWMSMRKSKEWGVLARHAIRITAGSLIAFAIIVAIAGHSVPWWSGPVFALINGVAHFAIDAVTSRMTSKLWQKERVHDFFVVIGFDQFLHLALATVTLAWLVAT
jgi:hypothetical protein